MGDVCGGHYEEPGVVARQRLSAPTYSHHPRPTPKPPCELPHLHLMANSFFLGYPTRRLPSMAHCSITSRLILILGIDLDHFGNRMHVNGTNLSWYLLSRFVDRRDLGEFYSVVSVLTAVLNMSEANGLKSIINKRRSTDRCYLSVEYNVK